MAMFMRGMIFPGGREPQLTGEHVTLRYPRMGDYAQWSALREESRSFLTPWEPTWAPDELSRGAFRRRITRYTREIRSDVAYPFFVLRKSDGALAGGLTLSNVRRGVTQSCSLGYWVGARFARQGVMTEAVSAVTPFVFQTLGLHRLEAACIPENEPSRRLLARCGFQEEGRARRYLQINGRWQDHILFALLEDDARPA
jgi:ribosomal-protein-alanine N-acetyltransferase